MGTSASVLAGSIMWQPQFSRGGDDQPDGGGQPDYGSPTVVRSMQQHLQQQQQQQGPGSVIAAQMQQHHHQQQQQIPVGVSSANSAPAGGGGSTTHSGAPAKIVDDQVKVLAQIQIINYCTFSLTLQCFNYNKNVLNIILELRNYFILYYTIL